MKGKMACLVVAVLLVSMFVFFEVKPVQAAINENYLYNWVAAQLYVKMYRWEGGAWVYFETRDFNYSTHWYARKFLYNYGIRYPTIMKLNTRLYPTAGVTDYSTCHFLLIGMEDSYQVNEGYDDLILGVGASVSDSGKYYTFIDIIMGNGAYRKVVYRKACFGQPERLLMDYPTVKQGAPDTMGGTIPWAWMTFEDYCFPDGVSNGGINMPSGTSDYSYVRPVDQTLTQWECRKLGAKIYGYNGTINGVPQFVFRYDRYRWQPKTDNSAKWYLKYYVKNGYDVNATQKIIKYVIGLEDMSYEPLGLLDSFHDLIVVLVHTETRRADGMIDHVFTLGMVQICGGLNKKVMYEQSTDYWVVKFEGFTANPPQRYAYNIPLETIRDWTWD